MLQILLYIFIGVIIIQFIYYIGIFSNLSFKKASQKPKINHPVSIIVCAKNEADNILKLVPALLNQNYTNYEIVLIDDASSDETLDIFKNFEKQSQLIRIVKVQNNEAFWGHKKYALTLGIKAATKPYLLFTDADCVPNSENWIIEMTSNFTSNKSIVLGYGKYKTIRKSFLNKLIRFETLLTATQYLSWAKIGKPYMGVGRNLAYTKDEFFRVNGFIEHMSVRSGDDDLFVNQASSKNNTNICYTPNSFTTSEPKKTYSAWFKQKRRHVSTAKHYKTFDKLQLSIFFITTILFYFLLILLLAFQYEWIIVLSLILFRYIFTWTTLGLAANKLEEKGVMLLYPIIEISLIFTQFSVFVTNIFSKPVHWK